MMRGQGNRGWWSEKELWIDGFWTEAVMKKMCC